MLNMFRKKPDHPLADVKATQAMLEDLPKNDPMKMVQELTHWIESIRQSDDFRLDTQLAVLRLLDETAHPNVRKLAHDYFVVHSLSSVQENRLWTALNEFYTQSGLTYLKVLQRYRAGDKSSTAIKPMLALVAARGIAATAGKLKCMATRYATVETATWAQLAEFFAHAEAEKYADESVTLYASTRAQTNARTEFVTTLMWYASSASSMTRTYLHIAERLSIYLHSNFVINNSYMSGCLFGFDTAQGSAPMRVGAGAVMPSTMRFFGVQDIYAAMDALNAALAKNTVPDGINAGNAFEPDEVRVVLQHLARYWTSPPPMRRAGRHSIEVNMNVARGFSGLMEQTDVGLNFSHHDNLVWEVEDISLGGFRCVLPPAQASGIEIGMLIGLKPDQLGRWGAGVVRRLVRDEQNNMHVGVEILSNQVMGISLRADGLNEEQTAIWLSGADKEGEAETSLLMHLDGYAPNRSLHFQHADKNYLLMPVALIERGEDYDLARYRKIEEDLSGEE